MSVSRNGNNLKISGECNNEKGLVGSVERGSYNENRKGHGIFETAYR
jgi:hypothetical protein